MGESEFASQPVALYGAVQLAAALAYFVLVRAVSDPAGGLPLAAAIGGDMKGKVSPLLYAAAIPIAFIAPGSPSVSTSSSRSSGSSRIRASSGPGGLRVR
jgi:hypothetical protein